MTERTIDSSLTRSIAAFGVAICLALLSGCGADRNEQTQPTQARILHVATDPRVELLSIARLLSRSDPSFDQLLFPYAAKVRAHFGRFRDDPSLAKFARADKALGGGDVPVFVVLHCTPSSDLKLETPLNPLIAEVASEPSAPQDLLAALREFAATSHFADFFARCRTDYADFERSVLRGVGANAVLGPFEAYHGQVLKDYRVIPAPMLFSANYGPQVIREDGSLQPYVVVARRRATARAPEFGGGATLQRLLWHEFGHSIVNPLVQAHRERLLPLAATIVPGSGKIGRGNYGFRCETYVSEYVIRAIGVRLTRRVVGESQA